MEGTHGEHSWRALLEGTHGEHFWGGTHGGLLEDLNVSLGLIDFEINFLTTNPASLFCLLVCFVSHLYPGCWASYLISLGLSFLICEMRPRNYPLTTLS